MRRERVYNRSVSDEPTSRRDRSAVPPRSHTSTPRPGAATGLRSVRHRGDGLVWPPADTDLDALEVVALAEDDGVVTTTEGDRTPGADSRETTTDEAWPWLQVDDLEALERFASESSTPARPDPTAPQPLLPPESGVGPLEQPAPVATAEGPPGRGARLFHDTVTLGTGEREAARALRVAIVGAAVILALASAWAAGWMDPAGWLGAW